MVGNGIFRIFRYSEGNLRQFAVMRNDPKNYLCQAWVSDEKVICGTDNGLLQIFEGGEPKDIIQTQAVKDGYV